MYVAAGRIQELLSALNLNEVGDQYIASYSGGMRQQIGIAQALLNNPKFLLLDEPSVGLDPDERVNLKNLITKAAQDATVIYSTHIVSDIEALAGSIIIMKQGRILAAGAVNQLTEPVEGLVWKMNVDYSGLATLQDNTYAVAAIDLATELRSVSFRQLRQAPGPSRSIPPLRMSTSISSTRMRSKENHQHDKNRLCLKSLVCISGPGEGTHTMSKLSVDNRSVCVLYLLLLSGE